MTDSGTYFYPHPSTPQYVMPYNPSLMYQNIPYQTPYNNSYSPVSAGSDFHDNQMLYYTAHQSYNYPQIRMRTFPQTNTEASATPSALQSQLMYRNGNGTLRCSHILMHVALFIYRFVWYSNFFKANILDFGVICRSA